MTDAPILDLITECAEARHTHGDRTYNAVTAAAWKAVTDAVAALTVARRLATTATTQASVSDEALSRACMKSWDASEFTSGECDAVHPMYAAAFEAGALSVASHRESAPVAVLRYEQGTPGRENEMPRVVSCNRMPDGEYAVYLAAPASGDVGAATVPEGMVLMPMEPTKEIKRATHKASMDHSPYREWINDEWPDFERIYRAQIATQRASKGDKQ